MLNFNTPIQIRWSDLDPNTHLRHSVYYDWGALSRVEFFNQHGLTMSYMQQHFIGPILFREECVFRKELHFGDKVFIDLQGTKAKKDFSRWSIRHTIYKVPDIISAIITVDGAWLDLTRRKLTIPPPIVEELFNSMPVSQDFVWLESIDPTTGIKRQ